MECEFSCVYWNITDNVKYSIVVVARISIFSVYSPKMPICTNIYSEINDNSNKMLKISRIRFEMHVEYSFIFLIIVVLCYFSKQQKKKKKFNNKRIERTKAAAECC